MFKIKKGRGKKGGREWGKSRKFETLGVVKDSLVPILFNWLKTGQGKD